MKDRSELIGYIRGESVGPAVPLGSPSIIDFNERVFVDPQPNRRGALAWRPVADGPIEEVLYFMRESPHRKYGMGLLHPEGDAGCSGADKQAVQSTDTLGAEVPNFEWEAADPPPNSEEDDGGSAEPASDSTSADNDFDVTSPDVRRPSTMGLSFCAHLPEGAELVVRLPPERRFAWHSPTDAAARLNGRYERCVRIRQVEGGAPTEESMWRRASAVGGGVECRIRRDHILPGSPIREPLALPEGVPLALDVELFPRLLKQSEDQYLVTVVLRNRRTTSAASDDREATLFQSYFEIEIVGGQLVPYPESQRPFSQLDDDEQSLMLLYRDSATWAIGHGCAAAWDAESGQDPTIVYADVMPTVELPSMTPDIVDDDGKPIMLRMRELAQLSNNGDGPAWLALRSLAHEYRRWITRQRDAAESLDQKLKSVAVKHLVACEECLARIERGIDLLARDSDARHAFRLANLAMILQQIATKQLQKRPIRWNAKARCAIPDGAPTSPWEIYRDGLEESRIGNWRAFQIAFLLMQLEGIARVQSTDRDVVDLIWFPTGGGKTEAYLGVAAFYLFHQRLTTISSTGTLQRDGTGVLMRYTLRMLTTQQFQRAASLICAMEFIRRNSREIDSTTIPGRRFSLALWIGGDGSPNSVRDAEGALRRYKRKPERGNPLVIAECPWCRAEIGFCDVPKQSARLAGISADARLFCPDSSCEFGRENQAYWIPVEVIDERIYEAVPSLVVGTADKFAMLAYRPKAGALLGRARSGATVEQRYCPPGLIIQDELHLIAGPLGTMYALYEGIIEQLCSYEEAGALVRPKIVASTATIRGAADQTRALYARLQPDDGEPNVRLFPSPGLSMGDSFFGVYARRDDGQLEHGRLYLGLNANEYGSILTAQVRTFSAALCRVARFDPDDRDPWWTLLAFYNSLRELGGAKTLFDSDIRSRLNFLQSREQVPDGERRYLSLVEELTSRLTQAEIVTMMDRLQVSYEEHTPKRKAYDACLASNIIEVGVDIDRLSLMAVVGQPKTTAQYIQVTGRVGRRWKDRPGLILMLYSPSKSRDRSHYEQFHAYHRRLYERVEPTSATPFAVSAIQRALCGALITWARQQLNTDVADFEGYREAVEAGFDILVARCQLVQRPEDVESSIAEMERIKSELLKRWSRRPQLFEEFPPSPTGEYLMLWPGQYATLKQKTDAVVVPSSLRQVDASAELRITPAYRVTRL